MTFIAVVLAAAVIAPATSPHEIVIRTMSSSDGQRLQLAVTADQVATVHEWDPETGFDPPLGRELAIELARDSVRKRYPQFESFRVESIELARLPMNSSRWFYVVKFAPFSDGQLFRSTGALAMVLLDGTVVEPQPMNPSHPTEPPSKSE